MDREQGTCAPRARRARVARWPGAIALTLALAACSQTPPPAPPPPPPPVTVQAIPPRPLPPGNAAPTLPLPALDAGGVRQTVNYHLSPAQTLWNLRSAYNVAALNCLDPKYAAIVVNYRQFLKANAKKLTATQKAIDGEFRSKFGPVFKDDEDAYVTHVYNYFSLPPVHEEFCDAALAMSTASPAIKAAELDGFAQTELGRIEQVFDRFYRAFEQYRIDAAAWDARYGPAARAGTAPAPVGTAPASSPPLPSSSGG